MGESDVRAEQLLVQMDAPIVHRAGWVVRRAGLRADRHVARFGPTNRRTIEIPARKSLLRAGIELKILLH